MMTFLDFSGGHNLNTWVLKSFQSWNTTGIWSEGDIIMEKWPEKCQVFGSKGGEKEVQANEYGQPLVTRESKEVNFPQIQPYWHLKFSLKKPELDFSPIEV